MSDGVRLLLVRHAEPAAETRGRLLGTSDSGLSERGQRQAERLARRLGRLELAAVYASPARRALETAAPLVAPHGFQVRVDPALREIDFGRLEGLSYAEIEQAEPELYRRLIDQPTRTGFPEGEDYGALRRRTLEAVGAICARHRGEAVVLVTHSGPLRALLAGFLLIPDEAMFRLDPGFASVSVLDVIDGTPVLRQLDGDAIALPPWQRSLPNGSRDREPGAALKLERPSLPPGFDGSRARERQARPGGWRFDASERAAVWRAITDRRDIRRFRADPVADDVLSRLLEAAHRAPSVGMMQPWRFVVVRDEATKAAMQALAARERLVQAGHFDQRARDYLDLKVEGIREAPVSICVCCDRSAGGREVLGRHTIRDTDLYSTCLAIENLWLLARAEGIGVGWVSFYRPEDVSQLLALPEDVVPVAWLCVGYPDERPSRPGLETAGWQARRPLAGFVHAERWSGSSAPSPMTRERAVDATPAVVPPRWWRELASAVVPGDFAAALLTRDASDELVKPPGSLGSLEHALERWAMAIGAPPTPSPRPAVAVFAADHGVTRHPVSLYPARVGAQVAAAAARGETAIGVLAEALRAELVIVDVGLRGPKVPGVVDRRVVAGSADITRGAALSPAQVREAVEVGYAVAAELASRCDLLVLGEIGIGNTTVAAALLAALTGRAPEEVCGRGTGLDSQGLERKRRAVAEALSVNDVRSQDPIECLGRVGGLELAALVGAQLGAAANRCPVVLDGFATGVAALVACRLEPAVRDYLIAGHRSAEPAHALVLTELGLEPLLDLRMRLGEASGAALALPLLGLAAALQSGMSRFVEAGVDPGLGREAGQGPEANRS